ncbi:MAG TPA: methyltransferase domain-containing protein [Solirubrobacterales bacterium]|nr:methyltransferase domain-containing protein [Solirubrobacterales bacterium]
MPDAPDLAAVTAAQQQTWSEGDFSMVAAMITGVAENLAEALEILPDEKVLDVACGSGNGAIAAARRSWGGAVGCDFVPALLERGRERAAAERLGVEFVEADAQDLPFEDASFDVAMSIFGAMFAPDQERTAAELLRVVKPGGRIGMASWTPDGGLAKMFMVLAKHVGGPPPGTVPPVLWGSEEHVRKLFGDGIVELRAERRVSRQAFRSADHYLEFFRTYFGPLKTAFDKVGPEGAPALEADMRAYLEEVNENERALVLEPEYLQIVAIRA